MVLPSIDLEGGRAVKRVGGRRGSGIAVGDPLVYASKLKHAGFRAVHVVDLDGAELGRPVKEHLSIARRIVSEVGLEVQYGGGLRSVEAVNEACGFASSLVFGSAWVRKRGFLREARDACPDAVMVAAVDYGPWGEVLVDAWRAGAGLGIREAVRLAMEEGADGILLTAVGVEGRLVGPDVEAVLLARRLFPGIVEYSGGIRSLSDLQAVEEAGADYAVIGMAFASGILDVLEVAARYG